MKVAILSESPADEAAVRILVEAVLGVATESVGMPLRLRAHGWPSVLHILRGVLLHLHYHTDADGLVVVADSNNSPVHPPEEPGPTGSRGPSRLVQLRSVLADTRRDLRPVAQRDPLKTAIGLAVPAIEAWLLCGADPNVSEGAWVRGMDEERLPYSRNDLKRRVYGTDRPGLVLETRRAVEEARRIAQDIGLLASKFPIGFGALAGDVRTW